jgi:hypothetical protein
MSQKVNYEEVIDPSRTALFGELAQGGQLQVFGDYQTPYSADILQLDERVAAEIARFAVLSAQNYGSGPLDAPCLEPTYVQNQLGLPTTLARVDCSISPDGSLVFYETEDRPSGLGVTRAIHESAFGGGEQFRRAVLEHHERQLGSTPHVIVPSERSDTDDIDFYPSGHYRHDTPSSTTTAATLPEAATVIVKTSPSHSAHEARYQPLQERAAAPISSDGDRTYLARIGHGQLITLEQDQAVYLHSLESGRTRIDDLAEFLNDSDYGVAKARGSLTEAVVIRKPAEALTKQGTVTASKYPARVAELLEAKGAVVLQPFGRPFRAETTNPAQPNSTMQANGILRIYVLLGRRATQFTAQIPGGLYCLRRSNVVHGAGDTVFGGALVPDPEKVYHYDQEGNLLNA